MGFSFFTKSLCVACDEQALTPLGCSPAECKLLGLCGQIPGRRRGGCSGGAFQNRSQGPPFACGMRSLRPLDFDVGYVINRPETMVSAQPSYTSMLAGIPEGRALQIGVLGIAAPSASSPVSSLPPVSLRGKHGRRESWGSSSEGSQPEPAAPITSFLLLTTSQVVRLKKKRQRRGTLGPAQPASSPVQPPSSSVLPVSGPLQPDSSPVQPVSSSVQPQTSSPAQQPAVHPMIQPASRPAQQPAFLLAPSPAQLPPGTQSCPASRPANDSAGSPAGDSAGHPAGSPAGVPAGDPASVPAGDSAGLPAGDSAGPQPCPAGAQSCQACIPAGSYPVHPVRYGRPFRRQYSRWSNRHPVQSCWHFSRQPSLPPSSPPGLRLPLIARTPMAFPPWKLFLSQPIYYYCLFAVVNV